MPTARTQQQTEAGCQGNVGILIQPERLCHPSGVHISKSGDIKFADTIHFLPSGCFLARSGGLSGQEVWATGAPRSIPRAIVRVTRGAGKIASRVPRPVLPGRALPRIGAEAWSSKQRLDHATRRASFMATPLLCNREHR